MKKLWDLNKVFSSLELEGKGGGIIMGVTRLFLPWPFYTILTKKDTLYLLYIKSIAAVVTEFESAEYGGY